MFSSDHYAFDEALAYDSHDELFDLRAHSLRLSEGGRLMHLVFVDGRLVDGWSGSTEDSPYADIAARHDAERRPRVVEPPLPPRHEQMLAWLEAVTGGREELMAMAGTPVAVPLLRERLDPVADEPWLIADELLIDVREDLLTADLAAPLRHCLLLARDRTPELAQRMTPARLAGGIVWVVGKANAAIGPDGPVTQTRIADHLGTTALSSSGQQVLGHVRRLGWTAHRPWSSNVPALMPTGRVELLAASVRADLVGLREQALAEEARVLPSEVATSPQARVRNPSSTSSRTTGR